MSKEIKKVTAETYLTVDVDCPYCEHPMDIREDIGEAWLPNRFDIPECEIEINCPDCGNDFIVDKVFF